jgi:hypothetical protein
VIEADGDPLAWQTGCSPHQPRFDNNIAWRNLHTFDNGPTTPSTEASLASDGSSLSERSTQSPSVVFNNVSSLPQDADLVVERLTFPLTGSITVLLPDALFDRWWSSDGRWSQGIDTVEATKEIRVTATTSATIGAIPLYAAEEAVVDLRYDAHTGETFEVRLYQQMHGVVVGGVSYKWVIPAAEHRVYLPVVIRE